MAILGVLSWLLPVSAAPLPLLPTADRLNEPGPESESIAKLAGIWDVTETIWDAPGASPSTSIALVAERRAVGTMIQEIMRHPSSGDISRIDYLHFNRILGRWEYVSMDTRVPVGIMPANSFAGADEQGITLLFQPIAMPSSSVDVTGRMLRMDTVIIREGPDRDRKDQHFIMADGTGRKWLAHRYAYVRRN